MSLPIDAVRGSFLAALEEGPVVLSAPTGSGKSTQVPRWIDGRVVVVEPRRVACRSLAARVAELEGVSLGAEVGYRVRDDVRERADTRISFVTPGVALRDLARLERADVVVLDELHERRLDVDLLLGLLVGRARLVAMSATVDGDRVAAHLGGRHVLGEGRVHPVAVRHVGGVTLPSPKGLTERVVAALDACDHEGHVLVFLPGRAEISACADALRGRAGLRVLPLHGGLSLDEQSRAFASSDRRKVILATNVAETSITIDGIGVVIDGGLVRRTRYHKGRGYLTLAPIASDSAEQRAGRAGRTGPGLCLRLWDAAGILEARTPPEVHRESLVPMMLGAAAAGRRLEDLPLLDRPKDYALEAAREELTALGALDLQGALTDVGREVFSRPLDAPLARLLVEAEGTPLLADVIDLVSVLSVGRPLFVRAGEVDPEDDLRAAGCDVTAAILAMRQGEPSRHGLSAFVLREARRAAERLRRVYAVDAADEGAVDRHALARLFLRADPRLAHVARHRKKGRVAFANGGTELELGRDSAASRKLSELEAICVLDSRAVGIGTAKTVIFATCAMPVPLTWLRDAGLGRERVAAVKKKRGALLAQIERVYAKKVIDTREEVPRGELAREAVVRMILEGRLFRAARDEARDRLVARRLAAKLAAAGVQVAGVPLSVPSGEAPELEAHLVERVRALGVESGEDVGLLSGDDLLPEDLEPWVREVLDKEYPRTYEVGDASYEIDYDLAKKQVLMRMVRGTRTTAPPAGYLPRFPGFRVCVESRKGMHVIRG